MAGSNLKKFNRPEVLRELTFQNLIALLGKFDGYFKRVNFSFKNVSEDDFDYDTLVAILSNQMFVGEYEELFNAFALIGAMSADNRCDLLREFISHQSYADKLTENMSTADMALMVYLEDPEALNTLDIQFSATKKKSFAMYGAKRDLSNLVIEDAQISEFERLMNDVFLSKKRGRTARIYLPAIEGDEIQIVVRRGESFKRQGAVLDGKKSKTLAFQPESFDLLVINKKTAELRICVPTDPKWLEDAYCRNLSMALFGDYDSLSAPRINDLNRIKELGRSVLICNVSDELKRLSLISVTGHDSPDANLIKTLTAPDGDFFSDAQNANTTLANMGDIHEAKFLVKIGIRERTVTLKNSNRSGYDYDDFGMIVDAWLRAVGIIRTLNDTEAQTYVETTDPIRSVAVAV